MRNTRRKHEARAKLKRIANEAGKLPTSLLAVPGLRDATAAYPAFTRSVVGSNPTGGTNGSEGYVGVHPDADTDDDSQDQD